MTPEKRKATVEVVNTVVDHLADYGRNHYVIDQSDMYIETLEDFIKAYKVWIANDPLESEAISQSQSEA